MNSRIKSAIKRIVPYRVYSPLQDILRYAMSLRFPGTDYKCPFCHGEFSRFLATGIDAPILKELGVIGGGHRLNSVCPRCYSEDRERLILLFLENNMSYIFSEPVSVLHIAPERNLSKRLRHCSSVRYLSADLDSPLADVRMDITAMRIKSRSVDLVICNHVLEHIVDDRRAMGELFRVLKPGGVAILQVPIAMSIEETVEAPLIRDAAERERRFGQSDHVRIYGRDYLNRLKDAGFCVVTPAPPDFLDRSSIAQFGLLEDERLFVCSREYE